jgi:hypothetical protein
LQKREAVSFNADGFLLQLIILESVCYLFPKTKKKACLQVRQLHKFPRVGINAETVREAVLSPSLSNRFPLTLI